MTIISNSVLKQGAKYVFVCGLPRSGTSLLGRNIARMENCTGLQNTGVIEDEGCFLQNVYPTEEVFGGPGRFGFDPRAHLTEASQLLTSENIAKLRAAWHAYWDNSKTIFVEKTPANLLMTRFLQAAFPNSHFIVIMRHPVPVGMAAQKWKVNVTPLYRMFDHWLHCHSIYHQDKPYLERVYELTYENYVVDQDRYHREIAAFLGTSVPPPPQKDTFRTVVQWPNSGLIVPERTMEVGTGAHNQNYFDHWAELAMNSPFRHYYRYMIQKYESEFEVHDYSLIKGMEIGSRVIFGQGTIPSFVGRGYYCVAFTAALSRRLLTRCKSLIKQQLRKILPRFVKARMRRASHKDSSAKNPVFLRQT